MSSSKQIIRKLVAIMFTDIADFTKVSSENEEKAARIIGEQRKLFKPVVEEFGGQWLKEMGDGLLLIFLSTKKAIECALELQRLAKDAEGLNVRIGIHQGDVIIEDNDVLGDDVNIASRIEPFSAVGGISLSEKVLMDMMSSPEFKFKFLGIPQLKGVKQQVKIFALSSHGLPLPNLGDVPAKLEKPKTNLKNKIISAIATMVLSLLIFFSYPLLETLLLKSERAKSYKSLIIGDILVYENSDQANKPLALTISKAISKKLVNNGILKIFDSHISTASINQTKNNVLKLSGTILKDKESINTSFLLLHPDGSIFDTYEKSIRTIDLDHEISTLIEIVPIWILKSIFHRENSTKNEDNLGKYSIKPIEFHEITGFLTINNLDANQEAILKLGELDITDESSWIDIMLAEAYLQRSQLISDSDKFMTKAEMILSSIDQGKLSNQGYFHYVNALLKYYCDHLNEALELIKKAIKADKQEKRYRKFFRKLTAEYL